jgi:hypothetical protein
VSLSFPQPAVSTVPARSPATDNAPILLPLPDLAIKTILLSDHRPAQCDTGRRVHGPKCPHTA